MFALLRLFMRGRAELREDEALVEYIPQSLMKPLNWDEVFPRRAPIEIDLGCGDGAFLMTSKSRCSQSAPMIRRAGEKFI